MVQEDFILLNSLRNELKFYFYALPQVWEPTSATSQTYDIIIAVNKGVAYTL